MKRECLLEKEKKKKFYDADKRTSFMLTGKSRSYYSTSCFYRKCTKQVRFVNSEEVLVPLLTEHARNALDPLKRGGQHPFHL